MTYSEGDITGLSRRELLMRKADMDALVDIHTDAMVDPTTSDGDYVESENALVRAMRAARRIALAIGRLGKGD